MVCQNAPPTRKVGPYSVFFSFVLIMDRFFWSDFFCHEKVKSVFSKRRAIIRLFDISWIFFAPNRRLKSIMFVKKLTKIKFRLVYWPFFSLRFFRCCPKLSHKISFFSSKIKFTSVYRPFFPWKMQKMGNFCHIFLFTLYWLIFIHIFRQNQIYTGILAILSSNFLVFCLKSSPKISSYFRKSNLLWYIGPFFPSKMTKNGKFWPFYPLLLTY